MGARQNGQGKGTKVERRGPRQPWLPIACSLNGLWPNEHSLTGSVKHHEEWLLFFLQEPSEVLRHKEKTPGSHTQGDNMGAFDHLCPRTQ